MRTRSLRLVALAGLGFLFDAGPTDAQQLATDMKLEDAGFVMRRADTTEKLASLRRLPPRKFVTHTGASGRYYLYADPDNCRCVFVGWPTAFQAFRDMRARLPQPDNVGPGGNNVEADIIQDMDADTFDVPTDDILDYRF